MTQLLSVFNCYYCMTFSRVLQQFCVGRILFVALFAIERHGRHGAHSHGGSIHGIALNLMERPVQLRMFAHHVTFPLRTAFINLKIAKETNIVRLMQSRLC